MGRTDCQRADDSRGQNEGHGGADKFLDQQKLKWSTDWKQLADESRQPCSTPGVHAADESDTGEEEEESEESTDDEELAVDAAGIAEDIKRIRTAMLKHKICWEDLPAVLSRAADVALSSLGAAGPLKRPSTTNTVDTPCLPAKRRMSYEMLWDSI